MTILETIKALDAAWTAVPSDDRRAVVRLREMADGLQQKYAKTMPAETTRHRDCRPRFAVRLWGRTLELLGSLYTTPAVRYGADEEAWRERFWRSSIGIDQVMREVDREALLGGTALVVLQRATDGGLVPFVFGADRWVGIPSENDPRRLAAARILWRQWRQGTVVKSEWRIWTPDGCFTKTGTEPERDVEQFAVVPCSSTLSTLSYEGIPVGRDDLLQTLLDLNLTIEEINHAARLQRGQPVVFGLTKQQLVLAPDIIWRFNEPTSRAEFLRNNADIPAMLSTLQFDLTTFAASLSLPRDLFSVIAPSYSPSAAVIQARWAELGDYLAGRQPIARVWERDVHAEAAKMLRLSPDISVEYATAPQVLTPNEHLAELKFAVEQAVIPRHQLASQLYPHKTPRQVEELLATAESERREQQEQAALIAGHAADVGTV